MKLFIDYQKECPIGWTRIITAEDALIWLAFGTVKEISLPANELGLEVAKHIADSAKNTTLPRLKWYIHATDSQQRAVIEKLLRQADQFWG
jgi:hypothetical protein